MECYNCGAELEYGDICLNCGADVRVYRKIIMVSNGCYNEALAKAKVRDLSGAVECLKNALRYNKLNIDARNLLGLLYYEQGEVVSALSEWVISKNRQPDPQKNRAHHFLEEVRKNTSRLEQVNVTIKKYNQALQYCKQDGKDLAVIQLKKVISMNPGMIRARQLLGLLYIEDGKYELAIKTLREAAVTDVNNTLTLRYLQEAQNAQKQAGPPKKAAKEKAVSYRSGNETIIQPRYARDNSIAVTVVNILVGLVVGAAITGFLVVPGVKRSVQNDAKAQILEANDTISTRNQTITSLEQQIDELKDEIEGIQDDSKETESRISSYEQLAQALSSYTENDVDAAGLALSNVNTDYLSDKAENIYEKINMQVNAEYVRKMYDDGYAAYSARDFETAVACFEKVVVVEETYDNGNVLYYLAQSYRNVEDWENAKQYYQKVVELYPDSERAAISRNYLAMEQMQ